MKFSLQAGYRLRQYYSARRIVNLSDIESDKMFFSHKTTHPELPGRPQMGPTASISICRENSSTVYSCKDLVLFSLHNDKDIRIDIAQDFAASPTEKGLMNLSIAPQDFRRNRHCTSYQIESSPIIRRGLILQWQKNRSIRRQASL